MARLAVEIPEHHRAGLVGVALDADLRDALLDLVARRTGHRQTRHVALHVGHEDRYPQTREALRHHQQRDGLAGPGGAGHEPVPVAVSGQQMDRPFTISDQNVVHAWPPFEPVASRI
jgi:hypothetical protein